jgi:polyhydroxyalkanoate synthesis regulator protein
MKDLTVRHLQHTALAIRRMSGDSKFMYDVAELLEQAADQLANQPEELVWQTPIGRDTYVKVFWAGPLTRESVELLREMMRLYAEHAPTRAELNAQVGQADKIATMEATSGREP